MEFASIAQGVRLLNLTKTSPQFQFEFDSQVGVTHVVQFKTSVDDAEWKLHVTIAGDGTRKQVTDSFANAQRLYRVMNQ